MTDIHVVKADDWAGIYVDGALFDEGHSLSDLTWLRAIGVSLSNLHHVDDEWMYDQGRLPKRFSDIPAERLDNE